MARRVSTAFLRYCASGGLAAIVDAGLFHLLIGYGFQAVFASGISFSTAAVVNFFATSILVFRARPERTRFVAFVAFALIGLAVNSGVTVAAIHFAHIAPLLAKIGGIGVAFLLNFSLNYLVVFRKVAINDEKTYA